MQSGFAGGYSAWLNGVFLGSSQGSPTVSVTTDTWNVTSSLLRPGTTNVFVILQGEIYMWIRLGLLSRRIYDSQIIWGTANIFHALLSSTLTVWTLELSRRVVRERTLARRIQLNMPLYLASSGKEPRGIRGFAIVGSSATFSSWTLQGNQVRL